MIVTNIKGTFESGKEQEGFGLDKYLVQNLLGINRYLRKSKDVVFIVSGHGKVRVGKSTMAAQVGAFIAWILAGGILDFEVLETTEGLKVQINKIKHPTGPIKFNLEENMVFSPEDLMKRSAYLFDKYGKNQIIIYDEARAGLASARAMDSINKVMSEWFEACGQYGHIIILVLPNFFKLHEDYAVARSLFLIDVFEDKEYKKGYFNFYNELQKERLYYFGKRLIGVTAKYSSANESFWGRFSSWFPFDRKEYDKMKKAALNKVRRTKIERRFTRRFNASVYILKKELNISNEELAKRISKATGEEYSEDRIREIVEMVGEGILEDEGQ